MATPSHGDLVKQHYSTVWSAVGQEFRWKKGPAHELPEDFRILRFKRSDTWAFATCGMSQPGDHAGLELHVLTADETASDELVELLTVVAHFHRTAAEVGLGHTVNFGRPWLDDSHCTYGLISLPYLDGPDLEWMTRPKIRFLWLVPVTPEEVEFKKKFGLEALEQRFEERQFNYLEPHRPSVV